MEDGFCPQLLDLIPNEREIWKPRPAPADHHGTGSSSSSSSTFQEKQLELRLAPPGLEEVEVEEPINYSSKSGAKRAFLATVLASSSSSATTTHEEEQLQRRGAGVVGRELAEKKPCCPPPPAPPPPPPSHACAAVAHSSPLTRAVSTPVVGWPPVRSFRKNLATTTNKPSVESQKLPSEKATKPDNGGRGLFVKINMEGVPIGRKIDLKAYDNYDKLSLAVDELFRGLLEAQRDPKAVAAQKHTEKNQAITGLVDGTGEYTLVYEDDEGDKMLVGDVPWEMFVTQAKRLRVLKTSELSLLHLGNGKKTATRC